MNEKGTYMITGASKGLGRALSELVVSSGYSLAAISRSARDLSKLSKDLSKNLRAGQKVTIHPLDLCDQSAVRREFKVISKEHSSLRSLINNAGTWTGGKRIDELSDKDIQYSLNQNFFSAFNITKEFLELRKRKKSKQLLSIVFIGATSSLQGWESVGAFCIGKGAMRTFAQSLAREVGEDGVHVSHLIIDGLLDNGRTKGLNPKLHPSRFIKQTEVAKSILGITQQDPSCWTFEWDLRPFNENW